MGDLDDFKRGLADKFDQLDKLRETREKELSELQADQQESQSVAEETAIDLGEQIRPLIRLCAEALVERLGDGELLFANRTRDTAQVGGFAVVTTRKRLEAEVSILPLLDELRLCVQGWHYRSRRLNPRFKTEVYSSGEKTFAVSGMDMQEVHSWLGQALRECAKELYRGTQ